MNTTFKSDLLTDEIREKTSIFLGSGATSFPFPMAFGDDSVTCFFRCPSCDSSATVMDLLDLGNEETNAEGNCCQMYVAYLLSALPLIARDCIRYSVTPEQVRIYAMEYAYRSFGVGELAEGGAMSELDNFNEFMEALTENYDFTPNEKATRDALYYFLFR